MVHITCPVPICLVPISPIGYGKRAMDIFFADDAKQNNPSRPGMGPLVAVGGIHVPRESVHPLERELTGLCEEFGFPRAEEFKWSPRRDSWMYGGLTGDRRTEFLRRALQLAANRNVRAIVVIEDTGFRRVNPQVSHEEDVAVLFLERVHNRLHAARTDGIVIVDRPGGVRRDEDEFLAMCLETLQTGTRYVRPERIALNVLSTPSHLVRPLQLADVVCSCTTPLVAGEAMHSPAVFELIRPLLHSELQRVGGVGLKLHPDARYANLYHWLVGDTHFVRYPTGLPLPHRSYPYSTSPEIP